MNSSNFFSTPNITLDELLALLGYQTWESISCLFLLPPLSAIGIVTNSISALIFFRSKFTDPIFFYYRLLSLVYIVSSLISTPGGFCFSPLFLSKIDTFVCASYSQVYSPCVSLLFHYASVLEILILLTRMKLFSTFIKKHFSLSPEMISLLSFIICLIINLPLGFIFKVDSLGDYYYYDSEGTKKVGTFYNILNSEFATSLIGQLSLLVSYLMNILFTLIVGIILNISSIVQYKSHLKKLKAEALALQIKTSNQPLTSSSENLPVEYQTILKKKERNQRKIENNMFYLAITLCFISIISRIILTVAYAYFFIFSSSFVFLIIGTLSNFIYVIVPSSSILIFYSFNQMFRDELKKMFRLKNSMHL